VYLDCPRAYFGSPHIHGFSRSVNPIYSGEKIMNTNEIMKALNADLADELGSVLRCNTLFQTAESLRKPAEAAIFQQAALEETQHANRLAERIIHLGGNPVTAPRLLAYRKPGDFWLMLEDTLSRKREIVGQYRMHIWMCIEFLDPVTRLMLEEILSDEERQVYLWRSALQVDTEHNRLLETWKEQRDVLLTQSVAQPFGAA
jgi:bacterioferritin (cytochrome b1)